MLEAHFSTTWAFDAHMKAAAILERSDYKAAAKGHVIHATLVKQKDQSTSQRLQSLANVKMSKKDIADLLGENLGYSEWLAAQLVSVTPLDFRVRDADLEGLLQAYPRSIVIAMVSSQEAYDKMAQEQGAPQAAQQEAARQTTAPASPAEAGGSIVGTWSGQLNDGGLQRLGFGPDSRYAIAAYDAAGQQNYADAGNYKVTANSLWMASDSGGEQTYSYQIAGNSLTMKTDSSHTILQRESGDAGGQMALAQPPTRKPDNIAATPSAGNLEGIWAASISDPQFGNLEIQIYFGADGRYQSAIFYVDQNFGDQFSGRYKWDGSVLVFDDDDGTREVYQTEFGGGRLTLRNEEIGPWTFARMQ